MTVLLACNGPPDLVERTRELVRRRTGDDVAVTPTGGLRTARGDTVALAWRGAPLAVAPVADALRLRLGGRRVLWVDVDGERLGRCGTAFFALQLPRYVLFRVLRAVTSAATALLPRTRPTTTGPAPAGGQLAFVLPILPDLSHTFVYRELLALLEREPDARVVCLEHGAAAPVHPEAAALRERCRYVARRGVLGRYAAVLGTLLRSPRRCGRVFALYGDRAGELLGKGPLREPRHPGRGFELAAALRRHRPRHIHVYGSTYAANVAMEAACLLDVPFSISSYVDFDFDYDFKMLAEKYQLARFFRVCTRFCQTRLRELLDLPDTTRVPHIVWGLDLAHWTARAESPGRGVLFTACRLVEKKGLHVVPAALAELTARGFDLRWRIAGEGPERRRLRTLISEFGLGERVELLGPLPNDAVRAEIARADVALLPCVVAADGERDGIPIFLTEAMAAGLPVVTTPVSGIPELVADRETGFLAEPGSSRALAATLALALGDGELRARVAERGREAVHRTQSATRSAAELLRWIAGEPRLEAAPGAHPATPARGTP